MQKPFGKKDLGTKADKDEESYSGSVCYKKGRGGISACGYFVSICIHSVEIFINGNTQVDQKFYSRVEISLGF